MKSGPHDARHAGARPTRRRGGAASRRAAGAGPTLSPDELRRYARQISLPEIGAAGQRSLGESRVLLVGVGGLGSAAGYYLAAAGVGALGLADGDRLELGNLQRQIAHTAADLGRLKVESAARAFAALNPGLRLELYPARLSARTAGALVRRYDVVLDATDSLASKRMLNRACLRARVPFVHAGVSGFQGQAMTVLPGRSACLECLLDRASRSPATRPRGPLGVVPGLLGVVQAAEAIKCLLGLGELLANRLLVYDALRPSFRIVPVRRRPDCPACGRPGAR